MGSVLISSAFLSNTAWNAEALQNSSANATQLLPPAAPAPPRPAQPAPTHDISKDATSHTDGSRESEDLKDSSRTEGHNETHRRSGARAHRKAAHEGRTGQSSAANAANPPQDTSSQIEPAPFLAVLNDVLPQAAQVAAKAPVVADQEPQVRAQPISPRGTAAQNAPTLNVGSSQAAAVVPVAGYGKTQPPVPASNPALADEPASTELNSSLEITKETAADPKNGINQKIADRGDLAFAARVTPRTPATPALNWNDAQAAIAASRFDASAAGSETGAQDRTPTQPLHQAGQQGLKMETPAEQPAQAMADDPVAVGPNLLPASASNAASASVAETLSRGTGLVGVAAVTGSTTAGGAQNTLSGAPVAAGGPVSAQGSDKAAQSKQAEGNRAPEFLEPPVNEAGQRAREGMRDISLRISNKDQGDVQVRLSERAGELRVSVRTPDAALGRGLRDGLSDLVGNLEHSGYRAETWQPSGANASPSQDGSRDSASQHNSAQQQDAGGSGGGSGQQQNSRDHRQPDAQTPKWVGELESSLQRSNTPWLPSAAR